MNKKLFLGLSLALVFQCMASQDLGSIKKKATSHKTVVRKGSDTDTTTTTYFDKHGWLIGRHTIRMDHIRYVPNLDKYVPNKDIAYETIEEYSYEQTKKGLKQKSYEESSRFVKLGKGGKPNEEYTDNYEYEFNGPGGTRTYSVLDSDGDELGNFIEVWWASCGIAHSRTNSQSFGFDYGNHIFTSPKRPNKKFFLYYSFDCMGMACYGATSQKYLVYQQDWNSDMIYGTVFDKSYDNSYDYSYDRYYDSDDLISIYDLAINSSFSPYSLEEKICSWGPLDSSSLSVLAPKKSLYNVSSLPNKPLQIKKIIAIDGRDTSTILFDYKGDKVVKTSHIISYRSDEDASGYSSPNASWVMTDTTFTESFSLAGKTQLSDKAKAAGFSNWNRSNSGNAVSESVSFRDMGSSKPKDVSITLNKAYRVEWKDGNVVSAISGSGDTSSYRYYPMPNSLGLPFDWKLFSPVPGLTPVTANMPKKMGDRFCWDWFLNEKDRSVSCKIASFRQLSEAYIDMYQTIAESEYGGDSVVANPQKMERVKFNTLTFYY